MSSQKKQNQVATIKKNQEAEEASGYSHRVFCNFAAEKENAFSCRCFE